MGICTKKEYFIIRRHNEKFSFDKLIIYDTKSGEPLDRIVLNSYQQSSKNKFWFCNDDSLVLLESDQQVKIYSI